MGNELCVASGGCPHKVEKKKLSQNIFPNQDPKVDILLVNDTEIPLLLDVDQDCQRDCHHKGWQVGFAFTQIFLSCRSSQVVQLSQN